MLYSSLHRAAAAPMPSPVAPESQVLVAGTASASVTFTHPGAPPGTVYALNVLDEADNEVEPDSGSGLGPWVFPANDAQSYRAILTASAPDGQVTSATALVVVEPEVFVPLAWAPPAAVSVAAGNTSGVVTWTTPTGGEDPYTYDPVGIVADTAGASTTAAISTSGAGAGSTTVTGLVNGQTVVLQRTVTDDSGATRTIQAAVTVAATAASITPGTAPANQSLAAGTTVATIGTWGAPSGGTGPYTYALTDPTGGTTISGSGLGPWVAAGLTDGVTYAFLLTITDSLGAKGYSVVTIAVAASPSMGEWEVIGETLFTDADWTALSSADAGIAAPQHTIYGADGTTVRATIRNASAQARTVSIAPSSVGVKLVNGTAGASPAIGLWPATWDTLRASSRRDVHLLQIRATGYEPAGSGTFVHFLGFSTGTLATTPLMGLRITNTGSNVLISAYSYYLGGSPVAVRTVTAGVDRRWSVDLQLVIIDGGARHRLYVTVNPGTEWAPPETGIRATVDNASGVMTLGEASTPPAYNASSAGSRMAAVAYHDGTATVGSGIEIQALRYLRLPNGSR